MSNINRILEVARRVESLRSQLKVAEEELAALAAGPGRPARRAQRKGPPIRGTAGPSISQRVLGIVANSGRTGVARRDILAVIGSEHEAAVHSALKAHSAAGRIENDSGQWMVTAAYVQQSQAPAQRDTRPMRAQPAPEAFMGTQP